MTACFCYKLYRLFLVCESPFTKKIFQFALNKIKTLNLVINVKHWKVKQSLTTISLDEDIQLI